MTNAQHELQKKAVKLTKIPSNDPKIISDIENTLAYIDMLQEVNTDGVIPTISVAPWSAILREDTEEIARNPQPKELLNCSEQHTVWGNIVLPNIMK